MDGWVGERNERERERERERYESCSNICIKAHHKGEISPAPTNGP
jgi:hypothetical protein